MILKRLSEIIFFQSKKFTACKVKDEKYGMLMACNSDSMQSTEDYLSISREEAFKDPVKLKLQPTTILNCILVKGLNTNPSL